MWKSKEIEKEYLKNYYLKNKEKIRKRSKENYQKNKEKINKRMREYRKTSHAKAIRLSKKYNISLDKSYEYLSILNCEICGDSKLLAVDHDHKTGKIRGRLCYRCNRAMGAFKDSFKILQKAINYLKRI